jgi:putative hydrolase of the HAD superfamily
MFVRHAFSTTYKGVFFDAGNTLLRVYPSIGVVYSETARLYGLDVPAEVIEKAFKDMWTCTAPLVENEGHRLSYKEERDWWKHLVSEVFQRLGDISDFGGFFDRLYDRFAQSSSWRLYDDVLEVLDLLKSSGVVLALISNWDSRLPLICDHLGISRYFEALVVSALVGYEKPHRAIFKIALERTRLSSSEVLYVGDDPVLDYQGAKKAGMDALHLDRMDRFEPHPDRIRSLAELLDRISNHNHHPG